METQILISILNGFAIALAILLVLLIIEILSRRQYDKKNKLSLPDIKPNNVPKNKDHLTEYLSSKEWKNKAKSFKQELDK